MRRVSLVFILVAMILAACSPSSVTERIIEGQEGVTDVEIDDDTGQVQLDIETDDGNVSAVIGGGDIPAGFPIPVPDGGKVTSVVEQAYATSVTLEYVGADFGSIKEFFALWVESSGWEESNKFESSQPPTAGWTLSDGTAQYSISLTEAGGDVLVGLHVLSG